jgi:hypothetical protein
VRLRLAVVSAACALAVAGGGAVQAPAAPAPPRGHPAGIALAKRVIAAYRAVPGLRMTGTTRMQGTTARLDARARLAGGRITAIDLRMVLEGQRLRIVMRRGATHAQVPGHRCWLLLPQGEFRDFQSLFDHGAINLAGGSFAAPRRVGGLLTLRAVERALGENVPTLYRIDPATARIVSQRDLDSGDEIAVRALPRAPAIPAAAALCGGSGVA